jgi:hypothetical protein
MASVKSNPSLRQRVGARPECPALFRAEPQFSRAHHNFVPARLFRAGCLHFNNLRMGCLRLLVSGGRLNHRRISASKREPATRMHLAGSTPDLAVIHFFCWAELAVSSSRDTYGQSSLDAPPGNSERWHQPTHSKRAAVVQGCAAARASGRSIPTGIRRPRWAKFAEAL